MSPANGIKEKFKALIKDKFTHTKKDKFTKSVRQGPPVFLQEDHLWHFVSLLWEQEEDEKQGSQLINKLCEDYRWETDLELGSLSSEILRITRTSIANYCFTLLCGIKSLESGYRPCI